MRARYKIIIFIVLLGLTLGLGLYFEDLFLKIRYVRGEDAGRIVEILRRQDEQIKHIEQKRLSFRWPSMDAQGYQRSESERKRAINAYKLSDYDIEVIDRIVAKHRDKVKNKPQIYRGISYSLYAVAIIVSLVFLIEIFLLIKEGIKKYKTLKVREKSKVILWIMGWIIVVFDVISGLISEGKLSLFIVYFLSLSIPVLIIGGLKVYFLRRDH